MPSPARTARVRHVAIEQPGAAPDVERLARIRAFDAGLPDPVLYPGRSASINPPALPIEPSDAAYQQLGVSPDLAYTLRGQQEDRRFADPPGMQWDRSKIPPRDAPPPPDMQPGIDLQIQQLLKGGR